MTESAEKKWQQLRQDDPLLASELDALNPDREELYLLKHLYAGLDVHDIPSVSPERLLGYVRASIRMRKRVAYAPSVPDALFFSYVLPPRINNEYLDGSREWLYEQLQSRVQGKSMLNAALEVNLWCYEHATYLPTDDRTIGPLGMCRRARGRCGEESTLLVSALRAVGIPARQVYVPFWSHCDDNHAWVEFWADGRWYHMGACEPEPVPDAGWFDAAASRAMLIRSRVPDYENAALYRVVNSTGRYAATATLKVRVKRGGEPVKGITVRFLIINESRLSELYFAETDETGTVSCELGLGGLIVSAYVGGLVIEKTADLRHERTATLRWEDGFDPLCQEWESAWEITPPDERVPPFRDDQPEHLERLRSCEEIRRGYEDSFDNRTKWHRMARGNRREIDRFLSMEEYDAVDRELLLETLREKDFGDISCDVLEDCLKAALPWKKHHSVQQWQWKILAPRVENEMLQPVRTKLQAYFARMRFNNKTDVLDWMEQNLRKLPEYGLTDRRGNAWAYARRGVCPESEWGILAVQICRAMGIPASLEDETADSVKLTVCGEEPILWCENISLARWEAGGYAPVRNLKGNMLTLPKGSYSLITARRQIDGTVSARARRFVLDRDRVVTVQWEKDKTAQKLKAVPLPVQIEGRPSLLIWLQPGAEPTEHLLQEMLELKEEFQRGKWQIRLYIEHEEAVKNETYQRIMMSIPGCITDFIQYSERYQIQRSMGIGDRRLPLAVVLDSRGNGVYACANYNIGTAHTMLRILKML